MNQSYAAEELIRLEIPPQPAFVGVARVVVASVATTVEGVADERLEDLRLAVSEACTNAVEAHVAEGIDRSIVLRCILRHDVFEVHVEDATGNVEDATGNAVATVKGGREGDEEADWGLQLIRALVDDVSFAPASGGSGTSVCLSIRRSG